MVGGATCQVLTKTAEQGGNFRLLLKSKWTALSRCCGCCCCWWCGGMQKYRVLTFVRNIYIYIRWNDDPNIRRINRSICWNMKIVFGGNLSIRLSKFQLTWSGWRSSLRQERSWSSNVCFFVWESGELQGKLCVLQHWNDSYTQGQMSCGRWKCRWMAQARWENSENGSWIGG